VVDNAEALKRVETWPSRDLIKREIDPNYVAPKKSVLEQILPK
jgi:hypothetical protein